MLCPEAFLRGRTRPRSTEASVDRATPRGQHKRPLKGRYAPSLVGYNLNNKEMYLYKTLHEY
ncbi:hypothetical protein ACLOJK_030254 [Asimina triloba]